VVRGIAVLRVAVIAPTVARVTGCQRAEAVRGEQQPFDDIEHGDGLGTPQHRERQAHPEDLTSEEIRKTVIDALTRIAPEIDPASIEHGASFRDQLDLDSMDFLNFVLAVHDRLGVEIPESDYPRLSTLDGAVAYLVARLERTATTPRQSD
jgi:acyl carrier protein